jgi:hypothetical protein
LLLPKAIVGEYKILKLSPGLPYKGGFKGGGKIPEGNSSGGA